MISLNTLIQLLAKESIKNGELPLIRKKVGLERNHVYLLKKTNSNPTAKNITKLLFAISHPLAAIHEFFAQNPQATTLDLIIHLLTIQGIKMDNADRADKESEVLLQSAIGACNKLKVTPTTECIECLADIPKERSKAVNTNLCVGCAEVQELAANN